MSADDGGACVWGGFADLWLAEAEGNNIEYPEGETPAYNHRSGFKHGAQEDIFEPAVQVRNGRRSFRAVQDLGDLDE